MRGRLSSTFLAKGVPVSEKVRGGWTIYPSEAISEFRAVFGHRGSVLIKYFGALLGTGLLVVSSTDVCVWRQQHSFVI